ncbi:PREDICTED: C-X-C motif chemokine 5 [Dipodomys ordii]|uniref:C-X-C motif chemokine n=1 Tax=Dipodomys ordii TaxID=10020 RepID=A0A1S3FGK0_DIPOR|nr:PREDICTED: C-X-C motif chemokine 5 [Dipodomys ordii]
MSLLSSRPACARDSRCTPSLLLLLLLLLTWSRPLVEAGPVSAREVVVVRELRCTCLNTSLKVHPKRIARLQVTPAGPQCSKVEVIASLKNGNTVCLDPDAPWIKKVLEKMLDSGNKKRW